LAEAYVMDDCGAIGALYNDNYGWFSTLNACQYSGEFCEMEVRACWSDGYEKLGDILNRSRYYMASSAQSNSYYRWCFYERNLVGDPETPCLTKRGDGGTVVITYPTDGSTVTDPITVTTSTTGCIDTVEFYVDGVLMCTDTSAPFECYFDPCALKEDENMTISVIGYCSGVEEATHSVTVYVDCVEPPSITITYPTNGSTVTGPITVTTSTAGCIDTVEFYVDGVLMCTDTTDPFECYFDPCALKEDENMTISVIGYCSGVEEATHSVTVYVDCVEPYYVTITNPTNGSTVSGTVTCTADSNCTSVKWYINGVFRYEDTTAPFQYSWDTTQEAEDQQSTVTAEGIVSGSVEDTDSVTVTVDNEGECLGTALLSLLVLFGAAGIYRRR
ncbi:MAG: hypothetical protein HXS48_10145, partial [Theionarchaea archaeon]|nr:hypothetical protein [Theionarchaea archaeon]